MPRFSNRGAACPNKKPETQLVASRLGQPDSEFGVFMHKAGPYGFVIKKKNHHAPEEPFAAFARHSVEMKACRLVPADTADPGNVPIEFAAWVRQRGACCHNLHF